MTDIVERLRWLGYPYTIEAADEIERLRDSLVTVGAKVAFAKGEIDRARRATNSGMEYLVDADVACHAALTTDKRDD